MLPDRIRAFCGGYLVERAIEDALTGEVSRFAGQAEVMADEEGAVYEERGELALARGAPLVATRRYLWRPRKGLIAVLFEDGRAFHDFDPVAGGLATEHLCGEDLYRGGYQFAEWPRWSVTWEVTGPRKDYRSVTWYEPR